VTPTGGKKTFQPSLAKICLQLVGKDIVAKQEPDIDEDVSVELSHKRVACYANHTVDQPASRQDLP